MNNETWKKQRRSNKLLKHVEHDQLPNNGGLAIADHAQQW